MIVLSLDLAARTGWAIQYDTGHIRSGTWYLRRGRQMGRRSPVPMTRLWRRLNTILSNHDVSMVVFEETFARGDARFALDSLQMTVLMWAHLSGVPWLRVSPKQWKKTCLDSANASKVEYTIAAAKRWPDQRIVYDDQAAALWLLDYARIVGCQTPPKNTIA